MVYWVFDQMGKAELQQWVDANPGRIDDRDSEGITPLFATAYNRKSLSLVEWLLDEKGADVNARADFGLTATHAARSLDILNALCSRGADPTLSGVPRGRTPLMCHVAGMYELVSMIESNLKDPNEAVGMVARLLEDPRVRATIDVQDRDGNTALHHACDADDIKTITPKTHLLLKAGANPTITNESGETILDLIQQYRRTNHVAVALEQD